MFYIYLIIAFVLNASGNIFLKLGSQQGFSISSFSPIVLLTSNWQFIIGCLLFVLNVPFYFLALKNIPLSTAYPVMVGMSFLIVNTTAFFLFKESVNMLQIVGYVCMVVGIILVVGYGRA